MANDLKIERKVVVQLLSNEWLEKSKASDYCMRIARTMANWRHPGIARVYDFGQTSTSKYIIREYLDGISLSQLLKIMRSQVLWIPLLDATLIVVEICRSLAYAHQRNIMHGDLYPGNIFIIPDVSREKSYRPVIINLGVVSPTALHLVPSFPAYQPPEATTISEMEKSTDVFTSGVLLYELTAGQLPPVKPDLSILSSADSPLKDENIQAIDDGTSNTTEDLSNYHRISEINKQLFPSPRTIRPDLPEPLEQVILKAIASKPEERYSNSQEMLARLEEIVQAIKPIDTAPPGFSNVIGLVTILQSPAYNQQGEAKSYFEDTTRFEEAEQASTSQEKEIPTQNQIDLSKDQIHILVPNQTLRSIPMEPAGLTIGRGQENDLIIDHPSVSRYHARIDFDGKDYLVQDLKSLNGTYIENIRLTPGAPHTWLPGENLRIGEIWLRVERAGQAITTQAVLPKSPPLQQGNLDGAKEPAQTEIPTMFFSPDGRSIDPNQVYFSSGAGWVGVFLENSHFSVTPGFSVSSSLLLINKGPKTDTFLIGYQGIPLEWMSSSPRSKIVSANGQSEVEITFQPPRSPVGKIGRHPITLRVSSQNAPDQIVEFPLILTIAGFSQFSSKLQPENIPAGQLGKVLVNNQGNLPETFSVILEDRRHELIFDPSQAKINIPSGKAAIVEFRTSAVHTRWFGAEETFNFTAHVSSLGGQLQSHPGEIAIRGMIPLWAPIVLTTICLVMVCFLVMFYTQFSLPSRYSRQTDEAGQTSLAQAYQTTAAAATGTYQSLAGANQETKQAVTATAIWGIADDDQDNLANNLELLAGTKPDNPDTDEDGLKDGDEVNQSKTDPLKSDSDADGLNDGKEIEKGTDPLKKDTDGDGIIDSLDTDPLHAASKTPLILPSATPTRSTTPSLTNTPTKTSTPQLNLADLNISLTNNKATSVPGTRVHYTIKVKNNGPGSVSNAQVVDLFPSSISNLTWACSATENSKCKNLNGINNLNELIDLAANGSVTFEVDGVLIYSATGLLINTTNVNPPPGITDPNMVDNLAIDTDTLTPQASLMINMTDGRSSVSPGEVVTYTIIVSNDGPSAVNTVNITDEFPKKLTDVTWFCRATPGSDCQAIGVINGDINTFANLLPGGSTTIMAHGTVKSSASGTLSNSASITSYIDPTINNKNATDNTTIVPESDLLLEVITPITIPINTPITYTIYITNTGPSNASGVLLTQVLPPGVTFISASPEPPICEALVDKITCSLGDINASARKEVVIVLKSPAVTGPIESLIEVELEETDPSPANNSTTSTIQVQ